MVDSLDKRTAGFLRLKASSLAVGASPLSLHSDCFFTAKTGACANKVYCTRATAITLLSEFDFDQAQKPGSAHLLDSATSLRSSQNDESKPAGVLGGGSPLTSIVCTILLLTACGGGGGGGSSNPTTPPTPPAPPPFSCANGAAATDSTRFTDKPGAPACSAHLLAQLENLKDSATLPEGTRGATIIYDLLYLTGDEDDEVDDRRALLRANGYDGSGNYYLTDYSHARMTAGTLYHAAEVWRTYTAMVPVVPGAIVSPKIFGNANDPDASLNSSYNKDQILAAYRAARTANPITRTTRYAAPRAIFNMSLSGSHSLFHRIATDLQNSHSDFASQSNFADFAEGLVGVGSLGNSNAQWNSGFRKQSGGLLAAGFIHSQDISADRVLPDGLGEVIDDNEDNDYWDSVQISTQLTDLIAATPTSTLSVLVDHKSWTTPASKISAAFPTVSGSLQRQVNSAGNVRISFSNGTGVSLLDLLAGAAVHARTGHFYTAAYLNAAGDATQQNTPCGMLRDACFMLPYYTSPRGHHGTSFAAPRLAAFIDAVWLIWPTLTNQTMHTLLAGCTEDLGASGVDPIFGQGLLDFECVVNPSGGLRLPAQLQSVRGLRGALYGSSTASTSLTTYDAFGRDFEHQVLHRSLQAAPAFDPLAQCAHTFASYCGRLRRSTGSDKNLHLVSAISPQVASAWLTQAKGNLHLGIGAAYEGDSLFGMSGSGHFAIHHGRSLGIRLELDQPLSNFWNMRLSLTHYKGTASAAYPGAVSDLALEQSNSSITFERRFAKNSRAYLQAACSSGNSGSFNSFGTHIQLFGASNCLHSIGAQIHF